MLPADAKPTLWIDATTLAGWRGNPTGIARTLDMLLRHWLPASRLPVRLCRFDPVERGYVAEEATAVVRPRPVVVPGPAPAPVAARLPSDGWSALYWQRLPGDLRDGSWHLYHALKCAGRLGRTAWRRGARSLRRTAARLGRRRSVEPFRGGDVLFLGGTAWSDGPTAGELARLRQECGLRVAHLIYDITPLRCPHLCAPDVTRPFARWLPGALANTDLVLTISEYSKGDLQRYSREQGVDVPPIQAVRIGDEPGEGESVASPELTARNPGPFVLYVSSIALHKNQSLLFGVWRRLIERHGSGVPTLVLAGGSGWRAERILADLHSDAVLSRHVVHLPRASDAQLRWLYRHCLFTLFPSHYEGWGLPVAEGLLHGKYGICSSASSLPEVAGELADYHDPLDGLACLRLIERALFEPGFLAAREARVRSGYRPTPWKDAAARAFDALDTRFRLLDPPTREAA